MATSASHRTTEVKCVVFVLFVPYGLHSASTSNMESQIRVIQQHYRAIANMEDTRIYYFEVLKSHYRANSDNQYEYVCCLFLKIQQTSYLVSN